MNKRQREKQYKKVIKDIKKSIKISADNCYRRNRRSKMFSYLFIESFNFSQLNLDILGSLYAIDRLPEESDSMYRTRLLDVLKRNY